MRISFNKVTLVAIAAAALFGCSGRDETLRADVREVGAFQVIHMEGVARLDISVGAAPSVRIEAVGDALDRVKTEVRGETLYIESRPKDWLPTNGRPRVSVTIGVPTLTSFRVGGGNDVHLRGYAGGASSIEIEGAANIRADGELDSFTVRMAGAGHADFSGLTAKDVRVTVDGVGSVTVHAEEKLDATMNGIGAIYYIGAPRDVSTRMNGLGRIAKRESDEAEAVPDERAEFDLEKLQPEYEDDVRDGAANDVI